MTVYNHKTAASITALAKRIMETNLCKEIILTEPQECVLGMMKLDHSTPKYKFSRKWYVVEFHWLDYNEVNRWCIENFGPHPQNPDAWSRWYHTYTDKIHIRDEKDYHWFVLRWGA